MDRHLRRNVHASSVREANGRGARRPSRARRSPRRSNLPTLQRCDNQTSNRPNVASALVIALDSADAELPRHRQLANALRRHAGELEPGTRMPSEKDLVDATGFNRTTVRRAIDTLRAEG